jgi:hypothetical protein
MDNWTSVEDDLPKSTGNYLVTNMWGEVDKAHFYHKVKKWAGYSSGNIQAWMSLPKPYVKNS